MFISPNVVIQSDRMFASLEILQPTPQGSENTVSMMEAGMIPNVVDYYDVDTDPTGQFAPRWHVNGEIQVAGVFFFPRRVG